MLLAKNAQFLKRKDSHVVKKTFKIMLQGQSETSVSDWKRHLKEQSD